MSRLRASSGVAQAFRHPYAFLLAALTILAVEVAVVRQMPGLADASVMAMAVAADLVFLVPFLYYVMLVRGRGWPAFSVVPVFFLGVLATGWLLPAEHQSVVQALEWLVIPVELLVVGFLVVKARRLARRVQENPGSDFFDRLRQSAREVLGVKAAAEALAFEVAIAYYALFSWRAVPQIPRDAKSFTHYRKMSYGTVCAGLSVAVLVEIIPVHLLLELWTPVAAWIATVLSLYSLVWLAGDYRALVMRPTLITDDVLRLRVGLRWNAEIPLGSIRQLRRLAPQDAEPKDGYLSTAILGRPSYILELDREIDVRGVYGLNRRVDKIGLAVDDDVAFERALQATE